MTRMRGCLPGRHPGLGHRPPGEAAGFPIASIKAIHRDHGLARPPARMRDLKLGMWNTERTEGVATPPPTGSFTSNSRLAHNRNAV